MSINKNRYLYGFLAIFLVLILAGASCENQDVNVIENTNDNIINNSQTGDDQIIGGDKDEYGCLIAAGYTWCESKQKCLRTWEEECPVNSSSMSQSTESDDEEQATKNDSIVDQVDWQAYDNQKFGYSVLYPANSEIIGNDHNQYVEFVGPLEENERWPRISISHYDTDFFHPDEDADLREWIGASAGDQGTGIIGIDGIETLHVVQPRSEQSYGADYYYFVRNGQLFKITLLHTFDRQDWPMYMKFLSSFHFYSVEVPEVPSEETATSTDETTTSTPAQ